MKLKYSPTTIGWRKSEGRTERAGILLLARGVGVGRWGLVDGHSLGLPHSHFSVSVFFWAIRNPPTSRGHCLPISESLQLQLHQHQTGGKLGDQSPQYSRRREREEGKKKQKKPPLEFWEPFLPPIFDEGLSRKERKCSRKLNLRLRQWTEFTLSQPIRVPVPSKVYVSFV